MNFNDNMKNRIRNYGLWISFASFLLMILQLCGVHIVTEQYNEVTNTILTVLVTAGILNNPSTQNKGFGDDKSEEINRGVLNSPIYFFYIVC